MQPAQNPEYGEAMVAALELVWGEGFMSPGGPEEVAQIFGGMTIRGAEVLDIGCGIGGIDLLLAETYQAGHVVGIDIEAENIDLATARARRRGLGDRVSYRTVDDGPLPFAGERFDVVFSKDSIVHVVDKEALFRDIYRVLRPGGLFIASDWLRSDDNPASPDMQRYIESEGLSFAMASPAHYKKAMTAAGLHVVEIADRNAWYAKTARAELDAIRGPLRRRLIEIVGEAETDRQTLVWERMLVVLDSGELRPTHLKARKPG
jgi:ubiquinone/menaquinone biosynthesis C-methylase UbiE